MTKHKRGSTPAFPARRRILAVLAVCGLCELRYTAANEVYFERYLPTFECLVSSAKPATR